jgi:hypothetical protein
MPGVGSSFGGGTETSSFGSWDEVGGEPVYPIYLDLDARAQAGLQQAPYTRALAPAANVAAGFGASPLEFGGDAYDYGEMRIKPVTNLIAASGRSKQKRRPARRSGKR